MILLFDYTDIAATQLISPPLITAVLVVSVNNNNLVSICPILTRYPKDSIL
jgi:hypothetical protein